LTSVPPDKPCIASLAVGQLFKRLEGDTGAPVVLEVPYHLEVRESSIGAPAPSSP
jgi:hypothetical protein